MVNLTDEMVLKILERYNIELIDGEGNSLVLDNGEYKMMTLNELMQAINKNELAK